MSFIFEQNIPDISDFTSLLTTRQKKNTDVICMKLIVGTGRDELSFGRLHHFTGREEEEL